MEIPQALHNAWCLPGTAGSLWVGLAQEGFQICAPHLTGSDKPPVAPIGGSACVIHSLCCPVGGARPPPGMSHAKSQRRPTSGDAQRRQATVKPGQVPTERHRATPSDARNVTGGHGAAGSNPAVPTGRLSFSNIVPLHKSQQKSQPVAQRPIHRPAPSACHGAPPEHEPKQQSRQADQAKGQRSPSHPGSAQRPQTPANRPAPSPAHTPTASPTLTAAPQLPDAGKPACSTQACPRHQRRTAAGMTAAPPTGRHHRRDRHRHQETRLHPRHGEMPSRSAAEAMH